MDVSADSTALPGLRDARKASDDEASRARATVASYYVSATDDYRQWSAALNMHFGWWRWPLSPFDREAMVEATNEAVIDRLAIDDRSTAAVVDMGCGSGAVARTLVRRHPHARVVAVTVAPLQVEIGTQMNREAGVESRIHMHLADYAETSLPEAGFDQVFFVESACHAIGPEKSGPMREAARLLRPGGRLLVADGFRRDARPLPRWLEGAYRSWCRGWAIPEMPRLDAMANALATLGFHDIRVEDVSWRMAPSFAHIPWVATRYVLEEWRTRGRLSDWRRHHARASFLSIPLGLALRHFRYCIVTATRG